MPFSSARASRSLRSCPAGIGSKRVEGGLDDHRPEEGTDDDEQRGPGRGQRPPRPRGPAGEPDEGQQHEGGHRRVDRRRHQHVPPPQPPAAGGQAVPVPHHLAVRRQRERGQPPDDREREDAEQHLPAPAAAQRRGHGPDQAGAQPGQPQQGGDGEPQQERGEGGRPDGGGEGLRAGHLPGGQPRRRVDLGRAAGRCGERVPGRVHGDDDGEGGEQDDRGRQRRATAGHPTSSGTWTAGSCRAGRGPTARPTTPILVRGPRRGGRTAKAGASRGRRRPSSGRLGQPMMRRALL